jgi:hypothetical protein
VKPARTAIAGCGVAIMAYAVAGALTDPDVDPGGILVFLGATLIVHDAVWMPAVLLLGFLANRFAPRQHRAAVQVFAVVSAVLGVLALPLLLGVGRVPDNPSIQPLPYGRNLALAVLLAAGGWFLAALSRAIVRRTRRRTRTRPPRPDRVDRPDGVPGDAPRQ